MSTPLLRGKILIFSHTCLMCPCRAFMNEFFSPPCQKFVFSVFFGIFGSWKITLSAKKGFYIPTFSGEKKHTNIRKGLGRSTLNTCAQHQDLTSQKQRGHFEFCAIKVQKSRLRIVITWFRCRVDFGRLVWLNIGPTQSVLRMFALNFVQTLLGAPGSGSFRKKIDHFFFFLP